jgi:hypothetical protein
MNITHQFAVVLFDQDGDTLGSTAAEVDWVPAVEWASWHFRRNGELPLANGCGAASILPRWNSEMGEPYCSGFRVSFAREGTSPCMSDFPLSYFRGVAAKAAALFVKEGKLKQNDRFHYVVVALEKETSSVPAIPGLHVEDLTPPMHFVNSSVAEWQQRAKAVGVIHPDEMPVFCPQHILDQVAALTLADRGRETGGVLVGNLHCDPTVPEVFAEVTAQIPARHAQGDAVKLTFTPETWAAVDAAIKLRGRAEIYLGYWHSHPVFEWCKSRQCSIDKQRDCKLASNFFSADDQDVLRAVFPQGYNVAIVANDTAFQELTFSWFGWREGVVQPRGYHVMGDYYAT